MSLREGDDGDDGDDDRDEDGNNETLSVSKGKREAEQPRKRYALERCQEIYRYVMIRAKRLNLSESVPRDQDG